MTNVAIVTDSCASIPEGMITQLGIHTVAYYLHRGKEVLRDLVTIQRDEFLRWLPAASTLPTTASPGPGDYYQKYFEIISNGITDIISIHITSLGSGAYQAASLAKNMVKDNYPNVRIEIIDTKNVSLCQGWMVIEAARAAVAGVNMDQILSMVTKMIPACRMIQTADTLKYLYMGGRIGLAKRLMGAVLNIKPLISMKDGIVVGLGMAHSRLQAYKDMADFIIENAGQAKVKVAYVHAGALDEAKKLQKIVESKLDVVESFIAELSPALIVHTGPGTTGLCFYTVGEYLA